MPDTDTIHTEPRNAAQEPPFLQRLGIDLHPGEGLLCCVLFGMHFLVLAFQYASKSVRQASYVDTLGADQLPFVYLLSALASYPVLRLYGRLVDRFEQRWLIAGTSVFVAASLAGFWWLFSLGGGERRPPWVSVTFYVWIAVVGILLVSQLWSYSSHLLNPRQAKRLFGFIGAGGILGSMAGGQMARLMSEFFETRSALLLAAGLLLVLAVLLGFRARGAGSTPPPSPDENLADARDGMDVVRGSRYLRQIALVMLLSSMVAQVIDLQFAWVVEQETEGLDERTAVFGNLFTVMGLSAFLFQVLCTSRIHRLLGIGFALRVLPVTNGLGTLVFAFAAMSMPVLLWPAAWILKIGENGLRYSIDQSTRELLFQPVAPHERPQVKAFIDVFVQRLGKGAAAILLLPVVFHWATPKHAVWLSLALIAVWLVAVGVTTRHYIRSFRDSLLHGELEVDHRIDLSDARTLEVLIEGMGSSDSREVLNSLDLLVANGRGHLVPPIMLAHPEPEVRCKTLKILQIESRCDAAPMVEQLMVDPDASVRATATQTLVTLTPQDVRALMLDHLRDTDIRVRGVAVSYLAAQADDEVRRHAETALNEMLTDGDPEIRSEAARTLGSMPDPLHQAALVQLLYDKDPQVIRGAIHAVAQRVETGSRNPLYAPILISHLYNRRLKHDARNALVAYGESVIPSLQHFLNDNQEDIWVRRALPKTIARIGGSVALQALTESLEAATDQFLRRKVAEALYNLRTRDPSLHVEALLIEDQIAVECRAYLRALTDLWSLANERLRMVGPMARWMAKNGMPHLLERLLADSMDDHLRNIFVLLALLHPPRDMRAAHRSILSQHRTSRAHALEYLDNLLAGEIKRLVFAVIDDIPMAERLRRARRLFELSTSDSSTALRRLASNPPLFGDADGSWLAAAALHFIYDRRLEDLYPVIREAAAADRGPLVQETTELLLSRLEAPGVSS